jgi:hypothetical protein
VIGSTETENFVESSSTFEFFGTLCAHEPIMTLSTNEEASSNVFVNTAFVSYVVGASEHLA